MDLKINKTIKTIFDSGYLKKYNGDVFQSLSFAVRDGIVNNEDAWLSYDAWLLYDDELNSTELIKDFILLVERKTGVEFNQKDYSEIKIRIYLDPSNIGAILEEYLSSFD